MRRVGILLGCLLVSVLVFGTVLCRGASTQDEALARRFAPVLYFEHDETCYPVGVAYFVQHSELYRLSSLGPVLVNATPTLAYLGAYTDSSYYLDNQLGTIADNGIINDYQAYRASLGYTVYAHVVTNGRNIIIQYWFFYVFNPGDLNRHEADWEMAQIQVQGSTPSIAMYSQHQEGQRAAWSLVEADGDHMKVYVARGSHASYFRSFSGKLGVASDSVRDNGLVLQPTDYTIEVLDNQSWLSYGGSWGWAGGNQSVSVEAALLGEAGPKGPMFREDGRMWQDPQGWGMVLPQAQQPQFIAEWFFYNFLVFFLVVTVISLVVLAAVIVRRYRRTGLGPRVFSLLYIDGANTKSIGNLLCIVGLILTVLAVFYPWYSVSGSFSSAGQTLTLGNVLVIDAFHGISANFPSSQGPVPLGSLVVPFAYIVLIGTVLLVVGTVGISQSRKLGLRYIWRGVRLLLPFVLVLVFMLFIGQLASLVPTSVSEAAAPVRETLTAISHAPFQGSLSMTLADPPGSQLNMSWQIGWGMYLLLFASIAFFIAGILEISAQETFYGGSDLSMKQQNES